MRERSNLDMITGMILGAAAMYILDPQGGRRRRALARDKMVHALNNLRWNASRQARNAVNHAWGTVAEYRGKLRDRNIDDDTLLRRARAQIGHVVSHPGALDVAAHGGHVTVRGPVLRGECENIQQRLSVTRGVRSWTVDVQECDSAEGIPELQGESRWQRKTRTGSADALLEGVA